MKINFVLGNSADPDEILQRAGDKVSTRPLIFTSEILKGRGRVLWKELLEEVILHIHVFPYVLYCILF